MQFLFKRTLLLMNLLNEPQPQSHIESHLTTQLLRELTNGRDVMGWVPHVILLIHGFQSNLQLFFFFLHCKETESVPVFICDGLFADLKRVKTQVMQEEKKKKVLCTRTHMTWMRFVYVAHGKQLGGLDSLCVSEEVKKIKKTVEASQLLWCDSPVWRTVLSHFSCNLFCCSLFNWKGVRPRDDTSWAVSFPQSPSSLCIKL